MAARLIAGAAHACKAVPPGAHRVREQRRHVDSLAESARNCLCRERTAVRVDLVGVPAHAEVEQPVATGASSATPVGSAAVAVAPALNTRARFWLSDVDPAIDRAEQVQEETVERMDEEGVDAAGDTGESDPLLAIQDALQTFPADEIVLFTHSGGDQNWLEEGLIEDAKERFEAPVRHLVVEG